MSTTEANLFVNIISEFQGKGLTQAQTKLGSFEALAKRAAKTFAAVFAADKIIGFGKASVQAFLAEEKALALLDQTLRNVGLGFDSLNMNQFVKDLEAATGVAKDQLIPALQTLVTYTGNAAKSQDLLKLALDVSAGSGKDLQTVSDALAKAYAGQTTTLAKLGVGISSLTVQSKNFAQLQEILVKTWGGSAATAADTYSGKVARLKTAFDDLKVAVGQSLVDSFTTLAGSTGNIDGAMSKIQTLSMWLSGWVAALTGGFQIIEGLFVKIGSNPLVKWAMSHFTLLKWLLGAATSDVVKLGEQKAYDAKLRENTKILEQQYKTQKVVDDAAAKANAASLAAKNKQLALDKASLQLKQAAKVFDNQAAEVWAAQQGKITDSDKARLKLMQDQIALQDAINNNDAVLATSLASRVQQDITNIHALQGAVDGIKITDNPFQPLEDSALKTKMTIEQMIAALANITKGIPALQATIAPTSVTSTATSQLVNGLDFTSSGGMSVGQGAGQVPSVNVQVQIGNQAINDVVTTATQNSSASGVPLNYGRLNSNVLGNL